MNYTSTFNNIAYFVEIMLSVCELMKSGAVSQWQTSVRDSWPCFKFTREPLAL